MNQFTTALLGGSTSFGEFLVVFLVFLMLFGAKKLPEMARTLGRTLAELRRATREVQNELLTADLDRPAPRTPAPLLDPARTLSTGVAVAPPAREPAAAPLGEPQTESNDPAGQ